MITGVDAETVVNLLKESTQNQITQAGFFFTLAAWLHAGRVKKEIKENFNSLKESIDNLGLAFKKDLKAHNDRLDNLSERVETLEVSRKGVTK